MTTRSIVYAILSNFNAPVTYMAINDFLLQWEDPNKKGTIQFLDKWADLFNIETNTKTYFCHQINHIFTG